MYRREFRKFSTASFANCAYNSGWQSVLVRCVICKQTIAINDRRFTGGSSVVQLACAYDKSHGEESPSFIVRVRTSRNDLDDTYNVALTDCSKRTPLAQSTIYYRPCSNNTSGARDARSYVAMTNVAVIQIRSGRSGRVSRFAGLIDHCTTDAAKMRDP